MSRLPIVTPADLILLKLYAGGSQDHWDIEQLLARDDRDVLVETVNSRIVIVAATEPGGLGESQRTVGRRYFARRARRSAKNAMTAGSSMKS